MGRRPNLKKRVATHIRAGDMVVCPDASVGVLLDVRGSHAEVIFGPAGPARMYSWRALRQATPEEITEADLDGVGCNPYRGDEIYART